MIKIKLMLLTIKASLGYFYSYTTKENILNIVTEDRFNGLTTGNFNKKEKPSEFEVLQHFFLKPNLSNYNY